MDLNSREKLDVTFSKYFKKYSTIVERSSSGYTSREFLVLEEKYRKLIMPVILEFENKLKKDFLDYLNYRSIPYDFYLDSSNFTSHFLRTGYTHFINNAFSALRRAKILNLGTLDDNSFTHAQKLSHLSSYGIDVIQFYLTFGSFSSMLKGCKGIVLGPFVDSYLLSTESRFYKHSFYKMMSYIRFMRNRCAHSNQILSRHLASEISNSLSLDPSHTTYNLFRINHLAVLYFMFNTLEKDRAKFCFRKIYWFLYKNRKIINKNYMMLNLEKNTHKTLRKALKWNVMGFTFCSI